MKSFIISVIRFYRNFLSPLKLQCCRFYPCCSEYAMESIEKYGVLVGGINTVKRLLRCHPFSRGGYDPVYPVREDRATGKVNEVSNGVK